MGRIWSNGSGLALNAANLNSLENDLGRSIKPWTPNTGYSAGQAVVNPSGLVVTANATHTSGSSYTDANWSTSGIDARVAKTPQSVSATDAGRAKRDWALRFWDTQVADPTVAHPRVHIRGHSVVNSGKAIDTAHGFPTLVANALASWRTGTLVSIYGKNGYTTSDMLADVNGPTYPLPFATQPTSLVVLMCMLNDYYYGIAPATTKSNILQLIADYRSAENNTELGFIIMVEWLRHDTGGTPTNAWTDYVQIAHDVADADPYVTVLDIGARIDDSSTGTLGLFDVDKAHPNNAGHALIANMLLAEVTRGRYIAPANTVDLTTIWPQYTDVPLTARPTAATSQSLPVATTGANGWATESDGTQGWYWETKVPLLARKYTLDLYHRTGTDRGQYTISLDGTTIGTVIEGYAASASDTRTRAFDYTVTSAGMHTVRITMANKNASSTGYKASMSRLVFSPAP